MESSKEVKSPRDATKKEEAHQNLVADSSMHELSHSVITDCSLEPNLTISDCPQPHRPNSASTCASHRPLSATTITSAQEQVKPVRSTQTLSAQLRDEGSSQEKMQRQTTAWVAQADVAEISERFLSEANDARCLWAETQRVREHAEEMLRLNGHLHQSSFLEEFRAAKEDMGRLSADLRGVTQQIGAFSGDAVETQSHKL